MSTVFSLANVSRELAEYGLIHEIISKNTWTLNSADIPNSPVHAITYDTRQVTDATLLFIKGNFNPQYLDGLDRRGLVAYVAEQDYSHYTDVPGFVVSDVYAAMARVSAAFYGHPERELTIVGITGTKGKTTTACMTFDILSIYTHGKTAMFSSVFNCIDGVTREESHLTTPESLDSFRMMRQAREHGITHLVMEISSQAYKIGRVTGIHFTSAAFLNISPDHISPIEHPTFENYLYCKRQIIRNTDTLILNESSNYTALLKQDADRYRVPVITYGISEHNSRSENHYSISEKASVISVQKSNTQQFVPSVYLRENGSHRATLESTVSESLQLTMPGLFNISNATAAVALAYSLGIRMTDSAMLAVCKTTVPGRMMCYRNNTTHTTAYVDYAHNFASVDALLTFVEQQYSDTHPYITLVTGAAGNKALGRREEVMQAAHGRVQSYIFTAEDTDSEPFEQIAKQMQSYLTDTDAANTIILDREQAVRTAITTAKQHPEREDVVLIIGKGDERWIKVNNAHTPYKGDDVVAQQLLV